MCGIAGFLLRNNEAKAADVRAMTDVIRHRGPDDEGIYTDGPCGIGMRRLSIIDLSTGHQPMSNEDGSVWVVFNGEIYNYQGLRQDLIQRGHQFRTNSDTETLVHLYEEKGAEGLALLRGMFAFCIWDAKKRTHSAGPRPLWQEAALLRQYAERILFRQRTEVSASGRRAARSRSGSAAAVLPVRLHCRSLQPVSRHPQAHARMLDRVFGRRRGQARPLLAPAALLRRKSYRVVPRSRRGKSCASCSTNRCAFG